MISFKSYAKFKKLHYNNNSVTLYWPTYMSDIGCFNKIRTDKIRSENSACPKWSDSWGRYWMCEKPGLSRLMASLLSRQLQQDRQDRQTKQNSDNTNNEPQTSEKTLATTRYALVVIYIDALVFANVVWLSKHSIVVFISLNRPWSQSSSRFAPLGRALKVLWQWWTAPSSPSWPEISNYWTKNWPPLMLISSSTRSRPKLSKFKSHWYFITGQRSLIEDRTTHK